MTISAVLRSLTFLAVLTSLASAQIGPDPLTWVAGGNQNQIELYDRQGVIATTIPNPALFPALMRGVKLRDGTVWLSDSAFAQLHHMNSGGIMTTLNVPGGLHIAAHPGGGFWYLTTPSPFANCTLELRDAAGAVQFSVPTQINALQFVTLVCDPLGNAWIAGTGQITKFDGAGTVQAIITPPASISTMTVDGQGEIWAAASDRILHYMNTGAPLGNVASTGVQRLVTDANGRVRALRANAPLISTLDTLDPTTLTSLRSISLSLPSGNAIDRLDFDSLGRLWIIDTARQLWLVDADASNFQLAAPLLMPPAEGVINGLPLVRLEPDADFDGDGFMNRDEVGAGSDPMIGIDTPLLITPATPPVAGQALALNFDAPFRPGDLFFTGASLTSLPTGAPLSHVHAQEIPISFDSLFWFWVSPGNPLLPGGSSGVLNAAGHATLPLVLPPGSTGLSFFVTAISFDPTNGQPGRASLAVPITIL